MQFVWRGQHQGGGRGPPGVWVSEGWSVGTEGAAARGTNIVKMKPCVVTLQSTLREFWCCSYTWRQESRKSGDVSLLSTVGGRGGSGVKGAVQTGQVTQCPCSGWALGAGPPSELSACACHRKINASSLHKFHMHKSSWRATRVSWPTAANRVWSLGEALVHEAGRRFRLRRRSLLLVGRTEPSLCVCFSFFQRELSAFAALV